MNPAVSILLPVRNGAEFLGEALASMLTQTLGDCELVAVDDGSTDGTAALLAEAASRDSRVTIVPGPSQGISAALNAGLLHCRAELIARMDADDLSLPTRLEKQRQALLDAPALAAVGTQVEIFPRHTLAGGFLAYEGWLNSLTTPQRVREDCLVEAPLVHPAAMIRRAALEEVGGFQAQGWPEDYALWLSLLERGHALTNLPEVLFRWRDHPGRLTRTHSDYQWRSHVRLKAHHLRRTSLKERARCVLWGAGKTGRAFFRALSAEGVTIERFVDIDPRQIGRTLHGAKVIPPEELGPFAGTFLVAAVGAKGARAEIRGFLDRTGWSELTQYRCCG